MPFFVYLLVSADNKNTYVGASVDVDHRLRQHNGELKGGAKATQAKLGKGKWRRVVFVSEFPTWQAALQFEWRWKQITRKIGSPTLDKDKDKRVSKNAVSTTVVTKNAEVKETVTTEMIPTTIITASTASKDKDKAATTKDKEKIGCVHRRLIALKRLLGLEQSTSKAMPYSEWPVEPKINFEPDMVAEFEALFLGLE